LERYIDFLIYVFQLCIKSRCTFKAWRLCPSKVILNVTIFKCYRSWISAKRVSANRDVTPTSTSL